MGYTLITGASSGIGYDIAKLYAKDKASLILIARNEEKLKKIKEDFENRYDIKVIYLSLDITKENDVDYMFEYVEKNSLVVDNIINNAGAGSFGDFCDIDDNIDMNIVDLNIYAPTRIMKLFLPKLLERNYGGILNVCSTAAFGIGPRMAVYYATKSYLLQLTESISYEIEGSNVTISAFCPGPINTEFQKKAGIKKGELSKSYMMESEEAALCAYKGFKKGKKIIVPGIKNKLLVQSFRFLPRSIIGKIALKLNSR